MTNELWLYGVCAVSVLALAYGTLVVRGTLARNRILGDRRGETIEDFVREFEDSGYSRTVLEMAYQDLEKLAQMPIRRTDDLEKTLGFLPEDFETMFEKRCADLRIGDLWKSSHASMLPLKTAEDYVRFLSVVTSERRGPVVNPASLP